MKIHKCNNRIRMAFFLLCSVAALGGCSSKSSETVAPTNTSTVTPTISPTPVPTHTSTATPSADPTLTPEVTIEDTITVDIDKDIDKNGVEDNIQIFNFNDGTETLMTVYLNGDKILEFSDPNARLMGVYAFESLDLDEDGTNEIFIIADTDANSRGLVDVVCLKQVDDHWKLMVVPLNDQGNNGFDYKITRGKEEFEFIIAPKLTKQQIHFDASAFFVDDELGNDNSIQAYRKNNYKEGDELDYSLGRGISAAKTGIFKGRNCIIATEGLEVPYGNGIGEILTYYAYKEGKVEILNVEFQAY